MPLSFPWRFNRPNCIFATSFVPASAGNGLAFRAPYLFGASGDGKLISWNIADPSSVVELDNIALGGARVPIYPKLFGASNEFLAVPCNGSRELVIFDVSDPSNMVEVGAVSLNADVNYSCSGVAILGDVAAVSGAVQGATPLGQGIKVDISDPENPAVVDTWHWNGVHNYGSSGVTGFGDYFFFTISFSPITSLFVAVDKANFNTRAFYNTGGDGVRIGRPAVNEDGTVAFFPHGDHTKLAAVDITTPLTSIPLLDDIIVPWGAASANPWNAIAYRSRDKRVFWGHYNGADLRVAIVDATDPANLVNDGFLSSGGNGVHDVLIAEDACATLAYSLWAGGGIFLNGNPS